MSGEADETSVMVIRAWREPEGFRARVTIAPTISEREEWSAVFADPRAVAETVAGWAGDFAAGRALRPP